MRTLLVTHSFPPDGVAGVERYTESLAQELAAAGDAVTVVTRRVGDEGSIEAVTERLADGTVVIRYTGADVRLDNFLVHFERLEELFARTLRETRPDVVHVNHLIGLSPRFVELAHRLRIPVVLSLHDFYVACPLAHLSKLSGERCDGPDAGRECARTCFALEGPAALFRWSQRATYFRRLLRTVERVICPPGYLESYFIEHGADRARLRVVPLGIAARRGAIPRRRAGDGRLVLAYLGLVVQHKGVHVLIDALARARLGDVELRVLGRAPEPHYLDELRRRAADAPGLRLRLCGEYARTELPHLLGGVDAAVVPSIVPEAFPLAPREAIALGVPVFVSRIGGLPDAIEEGRTGVSFAAGDADALAALLGSFEVDADFRERLRAGVQAAEVTTIDGHARAVREIYEEAVVEYRAAGPPAAADATEQDVRFESMVGLGLAARR